MWKWIICCLTIACVRDDARAAEHLFSAEEQAWWAVQPLSNPPVPEAGGEWAINEVDRFVARQHVAAKLEPATEANRYELVRRATFDLHGLPPTPEQIKAFVYDGSPAAWERLIDELLASPRYGEHWAQHWLDVVRYAETDGYRADGFRPEAYRYRDYVIRSFNADKPYDQFVREQLAADEFAGDDPDTLIATAFLRHGIYEHNQRNARMHWDLILHEMTRVTGESLLGLGFGCAQCHDHKFDPILQKDYFGLQAYFSTTAWPNRTPLASASVLRRFEEEQGVWEEATAHLRGELDEMVAKAIADKAAYAVKQFPEDIQAMYNKPGSERSSYEEQMAALVQRQVHDQTLSIKPESQVKKDDSKRARYEELVEALKGFEHLKPSALPDAFVVKDISASPVPTFIASRTTKTNVEPGVLTLLGQDAPNVVATKQSTGRRLALANWITQPDNMLTTRVAVNRIWQHHFGQGIVPTPNDFGTLGEPPSHPDLLDWLAARFVAEGWQMKPMHRLIMNSATYRQTARRTAPKGGDQLDPSNRFLWRYPPRRLSAEQVRDAMLVASGQLTEKTDGASKPGTEKVRSVFVTRKRNSPDEVLGAFDAPSGFESAPTRQNTTTPTQSLLLTNNSWPVSRARAFAASLLGSEGEVNDQMIEQAYLRAFGRPVTEEESAAALAFVRAQATLVESLPPPPRDESKGFVSVKEQFGVAKGFGLGKDALKLARSGDYAQVHIEDTVWLEDVFTVEAVARLDSVYSSASVNTLASRWNGQHSGVGGWSMGITSAKSGYEPQNFIMQLVGEDVAGNISYEVIDSDLRIPLKKPMYLAVVVHPAPGGGTVTFYAKDLSEPKSAMQVSVVHHKRVGQIQQAGARLFIGGRDGGGQHTWDGSVARFTVRSGAQRVESLLPYDASPKERVFDFAFDAEASAPIEGGEWFRPEKASTKTATAPAHLISAMTDFCHALLISNEFLYLH